VPDVFWPKRCWNGRTLKMEIKISCPHCKSFLELRTSPEVVDSEVVDSNHELLYVAVYTDKAGNLGMDTASSIKPLADCMPKYREAFILRFPKDIVNNIRKWNQKMSIWEDFSEP
jgi:hypothetical protein